MEAGGDRVDTVAACVLHCTFDGQHPRARETSPARTGSTTAPPPNARAFTQDKEEVACTDTYWFF
jgi:hypothetical protein